MNPFQLINPEDVGGYLAGIGDGFNGKIVEAHFSSIDHPERLPESQRRHLAGAIEMHPSYLEAGANRAKYYPHYECPSDANLLPDADLHRALEDLGIMPETPVLVYGSEPDGTMAAARVVWGLMYAGVRTVRLLDGGLEAWIAHGGDVVGEIDKADAIARHSASGDLIPSPQQSSVVASPPWQTRREILATTEEVREIALHPESARAKLVDVRTRGEWDGSCTRHYPFFCAAGHIPNAIYQGDWDLLVEAELHRIGPRLEVVEKRWRELGIIDPGVESGETTLVFCCGTGWRSSISFLDALLLGLRARNYDDGFYGWAFSENRELVITGSS